MKQKAANIGKIIEVLSGGGLVIFPCETVYGAGVDVLSDEAIKRLSNYKQRPLGKPYAIMAADQKMAEDYVELNKTARNLYRNFLPGPLTVVSRLKSPSFAKASEGQAKLAKGVASESGTLGVRIPDYPFMLGLIKVFGRPIVATSANASYRKRPYKISDIWENISEKQKALVDLIIDAGELPHNEPSTVVDTTLDDPVVLRQGEIILGRQSSVVSRSEENTQNIGKELWQKYEKYAGQRAIIFALEGPMGAGKTQFTKGLARAMGIKEEVVSPTFNLEINYQIPSTNNQTNYKSQTTNLKQFDHIDAWRMQNGQELEELGLKGKIGDKSVMAIEWADRVAETIRKYNEEAVVVWVKIAYGKAENDRLISWGVV
jgi:L-threonylcarbamoyladenylate synthase